MFGPFFMVVELECHLQKQCGSQAMLIFPDKSLPCLCPYWALAVIALYDGLARAGMAEHKWDYIFPYLHQNQVSNVAERPTQAIHNNINTSMLTPEHSKHQKNKFTSRSMRKGTRTENHVHPDLNMAEEYTRSGHTRNSNNINMDAKGYIEHIPTLNTPGGLAARRCWSQQLSLCACYIQFQRR